MAGDISTCRHPGVSGVVGIAFDLPQSAFFEYSCNFVLLVMTVFHQNPAPGGQVLRRMRTQGLKSVEPFRARLQGIRGFMGKVAKF